MAKNCTPLKSKMHPLQTVIAPPFEILLKLWLFARWTLHEHLLFQRRLCCHGVAVMSTTEKQGSRLGALPLAFLLFVFLLLLPLGELLLPLFAVIIFSYLWDKETGKGLYDGLWKLNIISLLPDFLICHSVYLPNIQFSTTHERFSQL